MTNTISPLDAIERLSARMFSMRKKEAVSLLPYTPCKCYNPVWPSFWFNEVLADFSVGDVAYVAAELPGPYERELVISVTGDTHISFNGVEPKGYENRGMTSYRVLFREGKNLLIIRHRAEGEKPGFELYIGTELMPVFWPNGYIYKTRPIIPFGALYGFEGFACSRAYKPGETLPPPEIDAIDWVAPTAPKAADVIDFNFIERSGYNVASAVSWGMGSIALRHHAPLTVFADGRQIYHQESGCFTMKTDSETLFCVVAERGENGFGFTVESGSFQLPFYHTQHQDLTWLWLDGVRLNEKPLQFKAPYITESGDRTFYQFYREDTYLRPYLNTAFFGQWFYAIMIGHYGVLKMAERLEKTEYIEYFKASMQILEDYYDYILYDNQRFGISTFMHTAVRLHDLDGIGTIGMNTAELIRLTNGRHGRKLLSVLENALDNVPRTENGTFYRIKTFWTDDFFMSIPFLARLATLSDKTDYFAEAARQVRGFYDYLYMPDKNLFSHIYFVEEQKQNQIPWGRGNGWVMFALSELLLLMPNAHPDYSDMLSRFQTLTEGYLKMQGKDGMWHQVIDDETTYEECSGTGMFIIAMARGVKNGWLSRDILPQIQRAWNRMAETCLNEKGDLLGVCVGSGCSMERDYYRNLGACVNDDHGTGVFLLAAVEMLDLT